MISVVVTSYSERRLEDIEALLGSIERQTTDDFELVFVVEGSQALFGRVQELVRRSKVDGKVIRNRGQKGLAESRNLGMEIASGDYIGFIDDDVLVAPDWVARAEEAFRLHPDAVGITGPAYPLWMNKPMDWLPPEWDWLIGCSRWFKAKGVTEVRNCWGMNMCFSRVAIEKAGPFMPETGFHRGPMAEDVEFSLRTRVKTGGKLFFIPQMVVRHRVHQYRVSTRFVVERSSWLGKSRKAIHGLSEHDELTSRFESELVRDVVLRALPRIVVPKDLTLNGYLKRMKVVIVSIASLGIGYLQGVDRLALQ